MTPRDLGNINSKGNSCGNISRDFLGRPLHTLNPQRRHHGWCQPGKFSKFVPQRALKMHSQGLSVLRFFCKTLSKLLKFTLRNTLPHR